MSFKELVDMAKNLPLDLKLELIDKVNENIHFPIDPDVKSAWDAEIEKRIEEIDRGTLACISYEDVQDKVMKILGK